jgi:hypothetical protein
MKSRKSGNGESAATSADLAAQLAEHETALAAAREALKALEMERPADWRAPAASAGGFCEVEAAELHFRQVLVSSVRLRRFGCASRPSSRWRLAAGSDWASASGRAASIVRSLGLAGRSLAIASPWLSGVSSLRAPPVRSCAAGCGCISVATPHPVQERDEPFT